MKNDSQRQQPSQNSTWLDPEFIVYALAGLLVAGLGAHQLARWTLAAWADGARALPILIVAATTVAVVTLLISLRHRRRFLYLGLALAAVGFASYPLASFGFSLPSGWLD